MFTLFHSESKIKMKWLNYMCMYIYLFLSIKNNYKIEHLMYIEIICSLKSEWLMNISSQWRIHKKDLYNFYNILIINFIPNMYFKIESCSLCNDMMISV